MGQFLSFYAPVNPWKIPTHWFLCYVYFIESIDSTLFQITGVITEESLKHSPRARDLHNFLVFF